MTDSRVPLWSEKCATCVFRPGNLMQLQEGRLAELVAANRATGSLLICHDTTYGQQPVEVMCRGYFDAYAATSSVAQVMERLFGPDWFIEVDPDTGPAPAGPASSTPSARAEEHHP